MKTLLALARLIDGLNERVGRITVWLVLAATLVSAGNALASISNPTGFAGSGETVSSMHLCLLGTPRFTAQTL
jgi:hypothetical protein